MVGMSTEFGLVVYQERCLCRRITETYKRPPVQSFKLITPRLLPLADDPRGAADFCEDVRPARFDPRVPAFKLIPFTASDMVTLLSRTVAISSKPARILSVDA